MFWSYTSNNIKMAIFLFEDETNMKKHLIEEHAIVANSSVFPPLTAYLRVCAP